MVGKLIGGTCLRSLKPSGVLVESNKDTTTKAKKVSTLRGSAQLADPQGTHCVSAQYPDRGHFWFLFLCSGSKSPLLDYFTGKSFRE